MSEDGYVLAMAPCISCGAMVLFDPDRVPSLRVNAQGRPDPNGLREPVCKTCWDRRQAYRRAQGLPEEPLLPGAYGPEPRSYGDI
ncbi:MAG: hypothetical protein HGA45_21525 [Chloroflexales bacterium]|nr:hypothetical protein [Chloroflexales bacterium]